MDLYDLKEQFDTSGTLLCFNGLFYHGIIEEIGNAMRNHIAQESSAKESLMDVFAVYIELVQNISNYITLRGITGLAEASSTVAIARNSGKYVVSSGNIILHTDVDAVCMRVDEVNAMSRDEIKTQYRKQMRRDVAPNALGAGLGLLEIAKRSSAKMTYVVREMNSVNKFFTLTAYI